MPENDENHPWKSKDGLLKVALGAGIDPVYFVRTKRHPVDFVDSRCSMYPGIVNDEIELYKMIDWYRCESEVTRHNAEYLRWLTPNVQFIDVHYNHLGDPAKLRSYLRLIDIPDDEREQWVAFLRNNWMKTVTGHRGKLLRKQRDRLLMNPKFVNVILQELDDVIKYEELKGTSLYMKHWEGK
jgi:hypothetical protein